jgi:hypothetical protein
MWRLYTLHNVRRTLSYITLSKYVHYLICTLLMYNKFYRRVSLLVLLFLFSVVPVSVCCWLPTVCTVLLARGVSIFVLLSLLLVVPVSVCCQVPPTGLCSTVGERYLCFPFVVGNFGCPCLCLLYSTVGERCLCFRVIGSNFGCPSSGLLSGRSLSFFCSLLSVVMSRSIISDVLVVCYLF